MEKFKYKCVKANKMTIADLRLCDYVFSIANKAKINPKNTYSRGNIKIYELDRMFTMLPEKYIAYYVEFGNSSIAPSLAVIDTSVETIEYNARVYSGMPRFSTLDEIFPINDIPYLPEDSIEYIYNLSDINLDIFIEKIFTHIEHRANYQEYLINKQRNDDLDHKTRNSPIL